MDIRNLKTIACIFVLTLAVCLVSAHSNGVTAQALGQVAEAHAIGGGKCASGLGLAVGLMLVGLSPACEVVCFVAGWYALGAVATAC
jgi:hypothetical protein